MWASDSSRLSFRGLMVNHYLGLPALVARFKISISSEWYPHALQMSGHLCFSP